MWRDMNTNISRQDTSREDTLLAGSHSEVREAAVAPGVAGGGGGGVQGGTGRVDSAPDWTFSSPLSDRLLKERDLSLGFGASGAHKPQEGNGLWIRNPGYGYVGAAGSGAGIPVGLVRQPDIFRELVGRPADGVGGAYGVGVRREERGPDEGRGGSFVAYEGARVHLGANREESGSGSTGPGTAKRKGGDEEGAAVEGGIRSNPILRDGPGSEDAYKRLSRSRHMRDAPVPMRGLEVQPIAEIRPADSRVELAKEDEHALQLHDHNRAKPAPPPQPAGAAPGVGTGTQGGTAAEAAAAASGQPRPKSKRARSLALSAPTTNPTTSLTNTSAGTSPRGSDVNSRQQQVKGSYPAEVRSQALFKCVRLTGVEDGENEFAYQATVIIGGHIFKGLVRDRGLDNVTSCSYPAEVRSQALFKCVRLTGVEDGENEFAYQATVIIGGHIFKGIVRDRGLDNGTSGVPQSNVALTLTNTFSGTSPRGYDVNSGPPSGTVGIKVDMDAEEDGDKDDVSCSEYSSEDSEVASYDAEPNAIHDADDVDVERRKISDVRHNASTTKTSMGKEDQLRTDVQYFGFTSWDVKYDPSRTLVVGDVTTSEEQLCFVFFHPEAITGLFGCGFKGPYSTVSILLGKQKILMQEVTEEAWKQFWMSTYQGPFKPFLFGRKNNSVERAGHLQTKVFRLNKDEALSKLGISINGSQSQEFMGLKRSTVKGAGGAGSQSQEFMPLGLKRSMVKGAGGAGSQSQEFMPLGLKRSTVKGAGGAGSQSQEFMGLKRSTVKGAGGAETWEPSWKSWVKEVVDHLFHNSTAPLGLLKNVANLTSKGFPTHKLGEWSEDLAVGANRDANPTVENKSDAGSEQKMASLKGKVSVATGQEKKKFGEDEADIGSRQEKQPSVKDKDISHLGNDGKKLVVKVKFLGHDVPYFKYENGKPHEISRDHHDDLPGPCGPGGQTSDIKPELTVEFFRPHNIAKSISTKLDVEYMMGEIVDPTVECRDTWFQNHLSHSFMSVNKHVAQRRDTWAVGLKNDEQTITKVHEASTSLQNKRKLSGSLVGNISVLSISGSGSREQGITEKSSESGKSAGTVIHKVLENFPLFDVRDNCMSHRMSYTAIYNLHQEEDRDPSRYYFTNPMKMREKQGSGLQTRVALQAKAKWDLYGESKNDYEFEARKRLSRTTETLSEDTGFANKGLVAGKDKVFPYCRAQTTVVSQIFTKRLTINHKFSDIFHVQFEYEQNNDHIWNLYSEPCPVPVAMTKAANQEEQGSTQAAVSGTATQENQEEDDDDYVHV